MVFLCMCRCGYLEMISEVVDAQETFRSVWTEKAAFSLENVISTLLLKDY
jgi:hypothetical protein